MAMKDDSAISFLENGTIEIASDVDEDDYDGGLGSLTPHGGGGKISYRTNPASDYRQVVWHELVNHDLKGPSLKAPRVRTGRHTPGHPEYTQPIGVLSVTGALRASGKARKDASDRLDSKFNQNGKRKLTKKQLKQIRDERENYEDCKSLNLAYQNLGAPTQEENFHRILRRLIRVERLHVQHNSIRSLRGISLKCCQELNLSDNDISSFSDLPTTVNLVILNVANNDIQSLVGLKRFAHLKLLDLSNNPVQYVDGYRTRVFQLLPCLEVLDGTMKQPEDVLNLVGSAREEAEDDVEGSSCALM